MLTWFSYYIDPFTSIYKNKFLSNKVLFNKGVVRRDHHRITTSSNTNFNLLSFIFPFLSFSPIKHKSIKVVLKIKYFQLFEFFGETLGWKIERSFSFQKDTQGKKFDNNLHWSWKSKKKLERRNFIIICIGQ